MVIGVMLDSSFFNMHIMILILFTWRYDITPSDYVSMLITEYGMVRCASTSQLILCAFKHISDGISPCIVGLCGPLHGGY
jgi:hypothetical protein